MGTLCGSGQQGCPLCASGAVSGTELLWISGAGTGRDTMCHVCPSVCLSVYVCESEFRVQWQCTCLSVWQATSFPIQAPKKARVVRQTSPAPGGQKKSFPLSLPCHPQVSLEC